MKINLLVLENNISSWKIYWREDPPLLKMNRKQLQLWLFADARLKESLPVFMVFSSFSLASSMIVVPREYNVSCCLHQSPQRLHFMSPFDLFSYSTTPLSFLRCIISVKRSFLYVDKLDNDQSKRLTETVSERRSAFSWKIACIHVHSCVVHTSCHSRPDEL